MKLGDFLKEPLRLIEGVEEQLRKRQLYARRSALVTAAAGAFALIKSLTDNGAGLEKLGKVINELLRGNWHILAQGSVPIPELTGFVVAFAGLGSYALLRWTSVLMHESREPFRYTFSIAAFEPVKDTPGTRLTLEKDDR